MLTRREVQTQLIGRICNQVLSASERYCKTITARILRWRLLARRCHPPEIPWLSCTHDVALYEIIYVKKLMIHTGIHNVCLPLALAAGPNSLSKNRNYRHDCRISFVFEGLKVRFEVLLKQSCFAGARILIIYLYSSKSCLWKRNISAEDS